jgi:hypothetical protein
MGAKPITLAVPITLPSMDPVNSIAPLPPQKTTRGKSGIIHVPSVEAERKALSPIEIIPGFSNSWLLDVQLMTRAFYAPSRFPELQSEARVARDILSWERGFTNFQTHELSNGFSYTTAVWPKNNFYRSARYRAGKDSRLKIAYHCRPR